MHTMYTIKFFGVEADGIQVGPELVSCRADNDSDVITQANKLKETNTFGFGRVDRVLPARSFKIYDNSRLVYDSADDSEP